MNHVHGKSVEKHVWMVQAFEHVLCDWISCEQIKCLFREKNKCQYRSIYSTTLYTDPIHSDSESKPLESRSKRWKNVSNKTWTEKERKKFNRRSDFIDINIIERGYLIRTCSWRWSRNSLNVRCVRLVNRSCHRWIRSSLFDGILRFWIIASNLCLYKLTWKLSSHFILVSFILSLSLAFYCSQHNNDVLHVLWLNKKSLFSMIRKNDKR